MECYIPSLKSEKNNVIDEYYFFKGGEIMANENNEGKNQVLDEQVNQDQSMAEEEKQLIEQDSEDVHQEEQANGEESQGNEESDQTDPLALAQEKIQELETKLEEAENRILRLQADFENFRRRTRLDLEAAEKYRAQSLVTDILPVLDNFERALKVEADDEKSISILQGMEMIYRQLLDALKKEGVEAIECVGMQFDPHLHHAVMQVEDSEYESNIVVEELQKGYKLKDRVIRPSMVKVSQ
jgi:molecular chaperone GrpE